MAVLRLFGYWCGMTCASVVHRHALSLSLCVALFSVNGKCSLWCGSLVVGRMSWQRSFSYPQRPYLSTSTEDSKRATDYDRYSPICAEPAVDGDPVDALRCRWLSSPKMLASGKYWSIEPTAYSCGDEDHPAASAATS